MKIKFLFIILFLATINTVKASDNLIQLNENELKNNTVFDSEKAIVSNLSYPKISNIYVKDIGVGGYTIECTVTDDYEVSEVLFPTWTEKNGQDDIAWGKGEIIGNKVNYRVRSKDHKFEMGNYITHIYAYDNMGEKSEGVAVPTQKLINTAPKISNINVKDIDAGGYTIECTVTDDYEVSEVLFPTWTEKNGQDDIAWGKGEIIGNKVNYRVRSKDHKFEMGNYITHIYAYDNMGEKSEGVALPTQKLINTAPKISNINVKDIGVGGYTIECTVTDDYEVSEVLFPTWTEKNGQDDIAWGKGEIIGNKVTYRVRSKDHKFEMGNYITHIYVYDNMGEKSEGVALPTQKLINTAPKISNINVKDIGVGGYTIECTVTDDYEVSEVLFPTWAEKNGQDDIAWGKGEIIGNKVTYRVRSKDHKFEMGNYITHIYAYDNMGGKSEGIALPTQKLINTAPKISHINVKDIGVGGYTIECTVTDDYVVSEVLFPTWTEKNGQDDIAWGKGEIIGNKVTYRVRSKDHKFEMGNYITHIYAYDNMGGKSEGVALPTQKLINTAPKISHINVKDIGVGGYTIECTVTDDYVVSEVLFPTWTEKNGQDDIAWGKGEIIGNKAVFRVETKNHKYEIGSYITHIYAYDNLGVQSDGSSAPFIYIDSMENHKGWQILNGKKYFFNDKGELISNSPVKKVIDVSEHNGFIDWKKVKEEGNVDFVILRCGFGWGGSIDNWSGEDKQFANNLAGVRQYNIPFQIYLYSYAETVEEARMEAIFVNELYKKYNIDKNTTIYYDIENPEYLDHRVVDISKSQYEANIPTFINFLHSDGIKNVSVYSYTHYLETKLNSNIIIPYVTWVAEYNYNCNYNGTYSGWQYSSDERIPGIYGRVDVSVWFT